MRRVRLVLVTSVLLFAIGTAAVAEAPEATTLQVGAADGANAVFVFDRTAKPRAIVLRTTRVGVAGSRIEVTVDKAKTPVLSHVFAAGECKFGDAGSACEIVIPATNPAYRAILSRFKSGRLARVTIMDAGVMKMDETASLDGFAHALR
jgi:alkylation response protein AidB-like acyl-CoA dehydrogenase